MLKRWFGTAILFSAFLVGDFCSPLSNAPGLLLHPPPPLFPPLQNSQKGPTPNSAPLFRDYENADMFASASPELDGPPAGLPVAPSFPQASAPQISHMLNDASVSMLMKNETENHILDPISSNISETSLSAHTTMFTRTTTRSFTTRMPLFQPPRPLFAPPLTWTSLSRLPAAPPPLFSDPFQATKSFLAVRKDYEPIAHERKTRMLPSLFDLFRPLTLGFRSIFEFRKGPAQFEKVPRVPSPYIINPTFQLTCSPPLSWTFCEPICGTGDQAVDAENSVENAEMDIEEAIFDGFRRVHLALPSEDAVTIQYSPQTVMLEDFGDYFDRQGYKYKMQGNTVAHRVHKNNTQAVLPFSVELSASVRYQTSLTTVAAKQISNYMYQYLSLRKGARFTGEITVKEPRTQPLN